MPSVPPPATPSQLTSSETTPPPQLRLESSDRRDDQPPWEPWTAPAAIGVGLGLGLILSEIVAIVGQAGGSSLSNPSPAVSLIANFMVDAGFVAAALYFAALHNRVRPADFGFRRVPWRLAVGAVIAAGVGYWLLSDLYSS
jgi:hypothetical protein